MNLNDGFRRVFIIFNSFHFFHDENNAIVSVKVTEMGFDMKNQKNAIYIRIGKCVEVSANGKFAVCAGILLLALILSGMVVGLR